MKCIKCNVKNINKANYCKECGYHFSEEEQKAARKHTFVGFLEMIEDAKSIGTLSFITGHIAFKIASIVIILLIGINFWINQGTDFVLLNSEHYDIYYNTDLHEYYLLSLEDEIPLNFYKPNRVENILIHHYDHDGNLIEELTYEDNVDVILEAHDKDYYILDVDYLEEDVEAIKLYVLKKKS